MPTINAGQSLAAYEFTDAQNGILRRLTWTMRLVGYTTSALGFVLSAIGLWFSWVLARRTPGSHGLTYLVAGSWPAGLPGILFASIGIATLRASGDFNAITRTKGSDLPLLMDALTALTVSYRVQLWFAVLGAIVAAIFAANLVN